MSSAIAAKGEKFLAQVGLVRLALPISFGTGTVNAYLHRGDALTLIDTGVNRAASRDALELALRAVGVEIADIERIILTHHHGDHAGLAAALVETSGAACCGHPDLQAFSRIAYCEPQAQREYYVALMLRLGVPQEIVDTASARMNRGKPLGAEVQVSVSLRQGDRLGPFRVHHVPGHSPTDILLLNEADGYTLVGDHVLARMTAVPALQQPLPDDVGEGGLVAYCTSLQRSAELDLGWCCPGHGEPFLNHRKLVAKMMGHFERKSVRVLETLSDAPSTPFEVVQRLHPRGVNRNLFGSMSASAGQLEWLVSRGLVSLVVEDGVEHYRKKPCEG